MADLKTDLVTMSSTELGRLALMPRIAERRTTQREVAEQLGLGLRQVERLYAQCKALGAPGLVSKRRGAVSNRRLPVELRTTALSIVRASYGDFGPTLAHEMLVEKHGLVLSVETVRKWMREDGLWQTRRERKRAQQPRRRRACVGELVQIDGSDHEWFEQRGPRCTLRGISNIEAGNAFLQEFGDDYNRRFACEPQSAHDAHRPLLAHESLAQTFTVQESRKVSSMNLTLHYNRVMYLLDPSELAEGTRGRNEQVREYEDGTVRIYLGNVELAARPFPKDNRVSQGAIVTHKLLAGALTVIQAQQRERDRRALEEGRMTRRERTHLQKAMQEAWPDVHQKVMAATPVGVADALVADTLRAFSKRSA